MTLSEWKDDFKGFVKSLLMPRDDYKGIMEYIDEVPEPHWIPVTERLPEVGESVLICDAYGDICTGHRANCGIHALTSLILSSQKSGK